MDDQEFIDHQYSLLTIYRRNLRIALEQAAQHGGESLAPLGLVSQIHLQRSCITQVRATLRDLGVIVDPQEGELPPKRPDEARRERPRHNLKNPGYREFIARPRYQRWLAGSLASRIPIVLVCGLGGSGKSSLVYETAYRAVSGDDEITQFEAAVWVSDKGSQGTTLAHVCDAIARTFGYRGLTQYDDMVKRREIEHLLRTRKTLLVIDNFETIQDPQIYSWLKERLPEPSKAIITTRRYDEKLSEKH